MDVRWFRFFDKRLDDAVVAVWEGVPALIAVEGWREATYEDALFDAALVPIRLA